MSTQPTRVFLKSMLIFPPGTTVNDLNVGSWWDGKSLFYQDYKDFKNTTIGNKSDNLSEILEKIEKQLVEWDLLENCDECDKTFSHLAHISVEKNWKIFWPKLIPMFDRNSINKQVGFKPHSVFAIPRDTVDNFITILWKSIRKHRLLTKPE